MGPESIIPLRAGIIGMEVKTFTLCSTNSVLGNTVLKFIFGNLNCKHSMLIS